MRIAETVTIVGMGLIGGSYGLAIRKRGLATHVIGVSRRESTLQAAKSLRACNETTPDLPFGCSRADLVLLCAPVSQIPSHAAVIADSLRPGSIVSDAGSTKAEIVRSCEQSLQGKTHFVGGHPMAGSEKSGIENASADLFEGATYVFTPTIHTDPEALHKMQQFAESLGARPVILDPEEHDAVAALTSHLPHAVAFSLASSIWHGNENKNALRALAASGFRDTTRLADSSAELWSGIFLQNRQFVLQALDQFQTKLGELRAAIVANDEHAVEQLLSEATMSRRKVLGSED